MRLLEALTAAIAELAGAGDHEAARIAYEAAGRLLGSACVEPAEVVELATRLRSSSRAGS